MLTINPSTKFKKSFRKLPKHIQSKIISLKIEFAVDPYLPKFKTHKLHGRFQDSLAFSINQEYRVIFQFTDKKTVLFVDIGTHAIYE